jgi:YHS domain-containing protein
MNKHSFHRISTSLCLGLALGLAVAAAPVHARHPTGVLDSDYDGVAIKGYDPVAYFAAGRAVKGSQEFAYEWLGTKWLFASAENRQRFVADPMSFAPQYGGYCSSVHLVAPGKADINPTAWRIVDEQLYIFYAEKEAVSQYGEQPQSNDSDVTWEQVKSGLAQ